MAPVMENPTVHPAVSLKKHKYTLMLDLDSTLIYTNEENIPGAQWICALEHEGLDAYLRPWAKKFLKQMARIYDIYVFTAATATYASPIVNKIDPTKKRIKYIFHREHCTFEDGSYTKDFTTLGFDPKTTVFVDDNSASFRGNELNGLLVEAWMGEIPDVHLKSLGPLLRQIVSRNADVRDEVKAHTRITYWSKEQGGTCEDTQS